MMRKRKPIGGLESQPSPKRTMKDPDVPPLRSPAQARTRLAEWPLIVDKPPDHRVDRPYSDVIIGSGLARSKASTRRA